MCLTNLPPASAHGIPEGIAFYSPQVSVILESPGKARVRRPAQFTFWGQALAAGMLEGQQTLPHINLFGIPNRSHIYILFAKMP